MLMTSRCLWIFAISALLALRASSAIIGELGTSWVARSRNEVGSTTQKQKMALDSATLKNIKYSANNKQRADVTFVKSTEDQQVSMSSDGLWGVGSSGSDATKNYLTKIVEVSSAVERRSIRSFKEV